MCEELRFGPLPEPTEAQLIERAKRFTTFLERETTMAETTAPILRVKLRVGEVFNQINDRGEIDNQRVKLFAVTSGSEENKEFSKWTPSATFDIYINNPNAYNKLANGHEYYVDFIPTPSEAS